jgi:hypothetical protein
MRFERACAAASSAFFFSCSFCFLTFSAFAAFVLATLAALSARFFSCSLILRCFSSFLIRASSFARRFLASFARFSIFSTRLLSAALSSAFCFLILLIAFCNLALSTTVASIGFTS